MFWNKKEKLSKIIHITDETFDDQVLKTDEPILLDFWAPWCGPCKMLNPIIEELAEEFEGRAMVAKINVDLNPVISQKFKIKSIPTLMLIRYQNVYERFNGMVPKPNLEELLEELITIEKPTFKEKEE